MDAREFTLRVPKEVYDVLQELARMGGATVPGYVEMMLRQAAEHYQKKVDEAVLKAVKEQRSE